MCEIAYKVCKTTKQICVAETKVVIFSCLISSQHQRTFFFVLLWPILTGDTGVLGYWSSAESSCGNNWDEKLFPQISVAKLSKFISSSIEVCLSQTTHQESSPPFSDSGIQALCIERSCRGFQLTQPRSGAQFCSLCSDQSYSMSPLHYKRAS